MSEQNDRQAALDEIFGDDPAKKAREKEIAKLEKKIQKAEQKREKYAAKHPNEDEYDEQKEDQNDKSAYAQIGNQSDDSTDEATSSRFDKSDEEEVLNKKALKKQEKAKKKMAKKLAKENEEINIVKDLISLCIYILFIVGLCWIVLTYVGQRTEVSGDSMNNTLQSGDSLWIDKLTYHFESPQRFDIVVFPFDDVSDEDTFYIKRIIGLPGETVYIAEDGVIYINDEPLTSDIYGRETIDETKRGVAAEPITLGPDEYFVLGDNRNNSRDSRIADVGNIHKDEFIGKAVFRFSKNFGKIE